MSALIEEKDKPSGITARDIARRVLKHENAVLVVVLIALVAGMGIITKGLTTTRVNALNILLQSSIRGVASVGQALVVLSAGIDLSVAGVGLFCATLGSTLMALNPEVSIVSQPYSIYTAIPIMLLVGVLWGVVNGSAISRLNMPALIVTIATWEVSKGAAVWVNKGRIIHPLPDNLAFLGSGTVAGVPVPVIIFIAVAVIAYFVLYHTPFGRSVYAVGGNPVTAWLTGIKVKDVLFTLYIISGFLAGLAGVIMTARTMSSSMQTLSGLELDTIAAVFIGGISMTGGKGNLIGVIIGVLIIGVINNAMSVLHAGAAIQAVVKGAIIISAVAIDCLRRR